MSAPARGKLWPLFIVMFLSNFALNASNVALPSLAADLALDHGDASLFLTTLTSAFAGSMLIGGRLGDRFGRRRLFIVGAAVAALAGAGAATAPGLIPLLVARVVQGAGLGLALPQVLATVQASRTGQRRHRALAVYAGVGGVGTAAGLVLGGLTVSLGGEHGWRTALGLLAAIAAVSALSAPLVPATRGSERGRLPLASSLLVIVALVLLTSSLALGAAHGWWPGPALGVGAALALGWLFWSMERAAERRSRPVLVPGAVAREPMLALGLGLVLLFFAPFAGFSATFALLTQGQLGLPAWAAGLGMLGLAVLFVVGSARLSRVRARWGAGTLERATGLQLVALLGVVVACLVALRLGGWVWWVQLPLVLLGLAQAWQYGPVLSTVMAHVPDELAGLTGGLFSTVQQVAMALGVVLMGTIFGSVGQVADGHLAFAVVAASQMLVSVGFLVVAGALRRRVVRADAAAEGGGEATGGAGGGSGGGARPTG